VSYFSKRIHTKLAEVEKQWQEAISRAQGPDYIETFFSSKQIRDYLADPVLFAREEWKWEPSPDQASFLNIWAELDVIDLQIMAARGTGKSQSIAAGTVWSMVFLPTVFGDYMTRVLAGSGDQAKRTYNYIRNFIIRSPRVSKLASFYPKSIYAALKNGSSCQVYKLSKAQVHGEHMELFIIDEACDAERREGGEIVSSAMQAVSSTKHGRRVLGSTPYFAFGVFAERWNNAQNLGIATFQWTAEVGKRTWMTLERQELEWNRAVKDPTVNIGVEWLGQFGQAVGQVHNPQWVDRAVQPYTRTRTPGAPAWVSVDWGYVHPTVIGVWELRHGVTVPLWMEENRKEGQEGLIQRILALRRQYNTGWVFADAAGVFQNQRVAELGTPLIPVAFGVTHGSNTEKEYLISLVNRLLELEKIQIHPDFKTLIQQMKAYTRDPKTGKPLKVNDDWEDCLLCAAKAIIVGVDSGVQVGYGTA